MNETRINIPDYTSMSLSELEKHLLEQLYNDLESTIQTLTRYNEWRTGADTQQLEGRVVTNALNEAIRLMKLHLALLPFHAKTIGQYNTVKVKNEWRNK